MILPKLNYRKHFFDELWIMRKKWFSTSYENNLSYKVRVACRFRPGEPPAGRVCLPLHQFLRLRRKQKLLKNNSQDKNENQENQSYNNSNSNNSNKIFVGARDPEEYCDPLLGTLMRDPVLLQTSHAIVDRSVALQCIARTGRDPFNNRSLTIEMLQPLPELALKIQEWRLRPERNDYTIDVSDVKHLVDDNIHSMNPELLETLLELERLQHTLQKVERDAYGNNNSNHNHNNMWLADEQDVNNNNNLNHEEAADVLINPDITVGLLDPEDNNNNATHNAFSLQNLLQQQHQLQQHLEENALQQQQLQNSKKNADIARLVEVNSNAHFVSMHVPGTGVRPFHFSTVYAANHDYAQEEMYQQTTRDSIQAVLNGNNACILCYGQTGKSI
jgi:hypothetical protein